MQNVNIILMGKTGSGKSTIVNTLLGKYIAKEGKGEAVTQQHAVYKTKKIMQNLKSPKEYNLCIHDTVGLEINQAITNKTLEDIRTCLRNAENDSIDDVNLVWFCINQECSRLEKYEINLINQMSLEYEVPFVILFTQCKSEGNEIRKEISKSLPEIKTFQVVAKEIPVKGNLLIKPFGIDEALIFSIEQFNAYKIMLLERKLERIRQDEKYAEEVEKKGKKIIELYSEKAGKAARFSVLGLPKIFSLCKKLIYEINTIVGIKNEKELAEQIFTNYIVGAVLSLPMVLPGLGKLAAEAYIESTGETYLDIVVTACRAKTYSKSIKEKIIDEITRRKKA